MERKEPFREEYTSKKSNIDRSCENCGKRKATWNNCGFFVCGYCKGATKRFINRLTKKKEE